MINATIPLNTAEEVRAFLRLCMAPRGKWQGRTVAKVAEVMPEWLARPLATHAPHVAELRAVVDAADAAAATARTAYLKALRLWIETDPQAGDPPPTANPGGGDAPCAL